MLVTFNLYITGAILIFKVESFNTGKSNVLCHQFFTGDCYPVKKLLFKKHSINQNAFSSNPLLPLVIRYCETGHVINEYFKH